MSVLPADIKFFHSSSNKLGGAIDLTDEVDYNRLHEVFDFVSGFQADNGMTDYRCLYVVNGSPTDDLKNVKLYIDTQPGVSTVTINLGAGTSAPSGIEPAIAQETDAPSGVIFSGAADLASAIDLGDLTMGNQKAFWIKREIAAGTPPSAQDSFSITVVGETD